MATRDDGPGTPRRAGQQEGSRVADADPFESRADAEADARDAIVGGHASLGVGRGSTRIKACLVGGGSSTVLAAGGHDWENRFDDRMWTYSLDDIHAGLQQAYAALVADVRRRYDVELT